MLYKRKIQQDINRWLLKDGIIVLSGPRQVGKTSLLELLRAELKRKKIKEDIYFYRTIHKAEIDFIFEKNGIVFPIEVKYKNFNKPIHSRILKNFCKSSKIKCKNSYLINLDLNRKESEKIVFLTFINFFKRLQ